MKDPGGTNALLPILEKLRNRHKVIYIADGIAPTILTKRNITFQTIPVRQNINQFLQKVKPALIFSTMCSNGGIGRQFIYEGKRLGIPTISLQDFWGARLNKEYRHKKFWPDYLLVPDISAKKIVNRLWKSYPRASIIISGYTAFHDFPSFKLAEKINRRLRKRLRIIKPWPIVFFLRDNLPEPRIHSCGL